MRSRASARPDCATAVAGLCAYSSAHGARMSSISKIHMAIDCCLYSLMAISLADHAMADISAEAGATKVRMQQISEDGPPQL